MRMNNWKILIKNIYTDEEKWYTCPLDKDAIFSELKLTDESLLIKDWETPYSLMLCYTIDDVMEEYNAYLMLPKVLQDNIGDIMEACDSTEDVLKYYNDRSLHLYPEYKTVYDYLRQSIEESGEVSANMLDYIDYDKYIKDFEIDNIVVETKDGLMVIEL